MLTQAKNCQRTAHTMYCYSNYNTCTQIYTRNNSSTTKPCFYSCAEAELLSCECYRQVFNGGNCLPRDGIISNKPSIRANVTVYVSLILNINAFICVLQYEAVSFSEGKRQNDYSLVQYRVSHLFVLENGSNISEREREVIVMDQRNWPFSGNDL